MIEIPAEKYNIIKTLDSPFVAERDYLECLIVAALFTNDKIAQNFILTGGTSVSKSYQFCRRLCNDVDIAYTGFYDLTPSRTIRELKVFKKEFKDFVFTDLYRQVSEIINGYGGRFRILTDRDYLKLLHQSNKESFPVLHLLRRSELNTGSCHVCIEVSPRKYSPTLVSNRPIIPFYIQDSIGMIPTASYAQTFWDKVYAMHIHNTMARTSCNPFFSRHLYDIAQMHSYIDMPQTVPLLFDVAHHQEIYTARNAPHISRPSDIQLRVGDTVISHLTQDYAANAPVCIPNAPSWDSVMRTVQMLDARIKTL